VGVFIKTSTISANVTNKTKFIEIISFYQVEFDVNLENLNGVSINIVTNNWNVHSKRVINTSGAMGVNAGDSGKFGGHFFGFGNNINGTGHLEIISNGGNGKDGNRGNSGDPIPTRAIDAPFPSRPSTPNRTPDRSTWSLFSGYKVYEFKFSNYEYGRKGNKGYIGNSGGNAGACGDATFIIIDTMKTKYTLTGNNGTIGIGGDGGDGGQGQENGRIRNASLVVHHNETEWNDDGLSSVATGFGSKGDSGDKGDNGKIIEKVNPELHKPKNSVDQAKTLIENYSKDNIITGLCNKFLELLTENASVKALI